MRLTASDFYRHYRRAGRCPIGKMVSMGTMMGSRRATRTLALICVLALAGPARWASAAAVVEIAKNPAAFDQKTVTVTGTATQVSKFAAFSSGSVDDEFAASAVTTRL